MKRDIIYFISVLLLTLVYFTEVNASEKIRMAIMEFQSDTVQQKGVLKDLLEAHARKKTKKYQIVTANDAIKSAISRYQSEFLTGITPEPSDINPKEISAELVLIPKADRFGETYVLTARILRLRTFRVIDSFHVKRKGSSEVLFNLIEELWFQIEPSYRYRGIEDVPID